MGFGVTIGLYDFKAGNSKYQEQNKSEIEDSANSLQSGRGKQVFFFFFKIDDLVKSQLVWIPTFAGMTKEEIGLLQIPQN